jgi:hypothetical protein
MDLLDFLRVVAEILYLTQEVLKIQPRTRLFGLILPALLQLELNPNFDVVKQSRA